MSNSQKAGELQVRIRPFCSQDYEALPEIDKAVNPERSFTVEYHVKADQSRDPRHLKERWICEIMCEAAGYGVLAHDSYFFHPRRFLIQLKVRPEFRKRGGGRLLFEAIENRLKELDADSANLSIRETNADGIEFAKKLGFEEIYRDFWSKLDLRTLDTNALAAARNKMASLGIRLLPLSELERDPAYRKKIHDLETLIVKDIPMPEDMPHPPLKEYWKYVDRVCPRRESFFVALKDERYVGMHLVFPGEDPRQFFISSTGVIPEFRRMGICRALKLEAMAYAVKKGGEEMNTFNNSRNHPVLEMNRRFGFVRSHAEIAFQKRYRPSS